MDNVDDRIQKLYEHEVNYRIGFFYDSGYTVEFGDAINGFTDYATFNTFEETINWLLEKAGIEHE